MLVDEARATLERERAFVAKFIRADYIDTCQRLLNELPENWLREMNEAELLTSFDQFCRDEYWIMRRVE